MINKNLDDYIEGRFNLNNPCNQEELPEFQSNDIQECFDYYRDSKDSEPLENAILRNEIKKQMVKDDITEVIKLFRTNGMDATANFLCGTRDKLK